MKFSLWLEKRNQKAAEKMPERMSSLELHHRASKKAVSQMQHGKAGTIQPKTKKGSRGEKNREAIRDRDLS
jgi:hypothetical protein